MQNILVDDYSRISDGSVGVGGKGSFQQEVAYSGLNHTGSGVCVCAGVFVYMRDDAGGGGKTI